MAELLALNLRHAGIRAVWSCDSDAAARELANGAPDLALLDEGLPGLGAVELLRQWKEAAATRAMPVIALADGDSDARRAAWLDAGADDCVSKPFSPRELMARARGLLRTEQSAAPGDLARVGLLEIDRPAMRARFNGQPVALGPAQFRLLERLMMHPNRTLSRAELLDALASGPHVSPRTVDSQVKRLRALLGPAGELIETARGEGYRISGERA